MYREVVSLHGRQFELWYENEQDRQNALIEAQGQCLTCGLHGDFIESMAATCPTASKVVGQSITLSSSPSGGTAPFKYSFYKMLPGTTTPIWLGTQQQTTSSISYTLTTSDMATSQGQTKFGVIVYDSCSAGSQTSEESCYIDVVAACTTPTANLTIG